MITFLRVVKTFGRPIRLEPDPSYRNTSPEARKAILDIAARQIADLRRANDAELAARRRFEDEAQAQADLIPRSEGEAA